MIRPVRNLAALVLGFATILQASTAFAQADFPNRPVNWIVPFPPGGSADIISRVIADKLRIAWGQPVIILNKPGASTIIATDAIAKSAPDGHTFGLVITAHVINPSLRKLPYDTLADLTGVTKLVDLHLALIASPSAPFNSVSELIAYSKANPGKLDFGTASGNGTSSHLFGELLNMTTGTSLQHIAYKGSSPLQTDMLGGQISLMVDSLASQLSMIEAGKMKVIALTSSKRHPNFPYPLVAETVPGVTADSFFGIVIPKATPKEIIDKINKDLVDALSTPEVQERMAQLGLIPVGSSPAEFDGFIRDEIKRWAKVIDQAGIKVD